MKSKTADVFYAFCVSMGGCAIALMYRTDLVTLAIALALSVAAALFCCFVNIKAQSSDLIRKIFSFGALVSSAVSVFVGCSLVTDYALDNTFLPICLLLCIITAVCLALSGIRALKSVASVMSVLCIALLLVILFLSVLESDFTKLCTGNADKKVLLPLCVFCATDIVFITPYIRRQNRCMFVIGSAIAPIYMLVTAAIAICTLTPDVYYSLDAPIITLWQSCYVVSFIDRFETLIVCVLFAITVIKAGILLKPVLKDSSKKLVLVFALLPLPLVFMPSLIYLYALLSVASVVIYVVHISLKKSY